MPSKTEVQNRDRALVCFLILTGGRVSAVISIKLKHVFLEDKRVDQHSQEVKTKYSKKIITYFLPVGELITEVFVEWVRFLKDEKLFDHNTPLFPSTKLTLDENDKFKQNDLDTTALQSITSIETIVKKAFQSAGLDYYNPHSFRHTVAHLAYQYCKTIEAAKAWSQNLGHNNLMTTFTSYGSIDEFNQGEIIKRLGNNDDNQPITRKEFEILLLKSRLVK